MVALSSLRNLSSHFLLEGKNSEQDPADLDADLDLEVGIPTIRGQNFVQELGCAQCAADAERAEAPEKGTLETLALPPCDFSVALPGGVQPGENVHLPGPHGRRLRLEVPQGCRPGQKLHLRLAPPAELRVQVPLGRGAGSRLRVKASSGAEVDVVVPDGLQPGDFFDVPHPCLMVAVPEGVRSGDYVVFRRHEVGRDGALETEYCRARVPSELLFDRYFAARLPQRQEAKEGAAPTGRSRRAGA